jgi:uncharacterized protein (DUF4415 family)
MRKATSKTLTAKQRAELAALAKIPDDRVDTRDIPEVRNWAGAKRGLFYRPIKQQLTLRIDADVIGWFKSHARKGEGYQTNMNLALREHVLQHQRRRKAG